MSRPADAASADPPDRGSTPVEFVLVGALLTVLTLGVLQFGLALHVRNVVHDAAVDGAHAAALADASPADGVQRTRELITRAIGADYARDISVSTDLALGVPAVRIRVVTPIPLAGLFGVPGGWEVTAHAPRESLG